MKNVKFFSVKSVFLNTIKNYKMPGSTPLGRLREKEQKLKSQLSAVSKKEHKLESEIKKIHKQRDKIKK